LPSLRFDVNRRALEQKYPIRAFVQTDCADGHGIEQLRHIIVEETDSLEHLRVAFPARWFQIKNTLATTKKNFLSFEEYRNVCASLGEGDPSAQNELALSLHNLGIALNYKDDPRLEHTHVLNPHWVTNGIYAVLNSRKLNYQKGEIRLSNLSDILDASDYPRNMHRFLLDLMKRFELCFSFADDECHYLIPELLDIQEPEDVGPFKPDECLNFEYHYDVLPEGLLPRFIVRTHVLSEGLARWRSGVILRLEGNTAVVKADTDDRKIVIHVTGPTAGRRRLLAVIRSDFDRIHRGMRNLMPQEMVPVPGQPDVIISYKDLVLWESEGRSTYPVRVSETILDLNVNILLDGVDLNPRQKGMSGRHVAPVKLFYSYSHKDESLRNELETHLKILHRQGLIEPWHDREIEAGQDWKREISDHLEEAKVILLLISADFIASDYCYEIEMKRALELHKSEEAIVIPVVLRDLNWSRTPFSKLQALPKDGKPVTEWPSKDAAWRNVSEGIERAIRSFRGLATS
jgi:internalin A